MTTDHDPDCLFCRIAAGKAAAGKAAAGKAAAGKLGTGKLGTGKAAATLLHEDELVIAIRDIAPRAPTHILLIPRRHIPSALSLTDTDGPLLGRLFAVAADLARSEGIADAGYRLVTNVGRWGGQSVDHLHVHLMGGRPFEWPPG